MQSNKKQHECNNQHDVQKHYLIKNQHECNTVDSHGRSNTRDFENFELIPFSGSIWPALSYSATKSWNYPL